MAEDRIAGQPVGYRELRRWALRSEALGFDTAWIYDHLLIRRPDVPDFGTWESWTIMSALAEATTHIGLASWVTCVSWRNPALLAKMATTLDEVSDGRLTLGLGAGNQRPEFDAFGFEYDGRVPRFQEAISIIAPLIRDGRVDVHGTYHVAADCQIRPRGPRPKGPPLLIGSDGPKMMRLTARYADLWTCTYLGDPAGLAEPRGRLAAACEAEGRDPDTLGITVGEWVVFPDINQPAPALTTFITGTGDTIARLLDAYRDLGVAEVMLQCGPENYDEALERLGAALATHRRG